MQSLTLKQLRYFEALARIGHFGRAAEDCAITQPALSMHIKELEGQVGAPLVERSARQVRLTALGQQFAARMGIKPPSVIDLEKSEALGTIQLKTLSRAAEALGCRLVYAVVPKAPLQDTVDARARRIALRALRRVAHSMKLEDQAVADSDLERQIENYIRQHIKDRDLWAERD